MAVVTGTPIHIDDFDVSLRDDKGEYHSWKRSAALKVVKNDPLKAHVELLDKITDKNMHDIVAYLESLNEIHQNDSFVALCAAPLFAQGSLDPAKVGQPPTDSWTSYHGDYSGRRYSALNKINASNINSLASRGSFEPTSIKARLKLLRWSSMA